MEPRVDPLENVTPCALLTYDGVVACTGFGVTYETVCGR